MTIAAPGQAGCGEGLWCWGIPHFLAQHSGTESQAPPGKHQPQGASASVNNITQSAFRCANTAMLDRLIRHALCFAQEPASDNSSSAKW